MVLIFSLLACGKKSPPPESKSESPSVPKVIVEKEKVEKERPLPPEVKIKLKKDGKDSYSLTLRKLSQINQALANVSFFGGGFCDINQSLFTPLSVSSPQGQ